MKCENCSETISAEREKAARDRGKVPRFHSTACKNSWHQRNRRKAEKIALNGKKPAPADTRSELWKWLGLDGIEVV